MKAVLTLSKTFFKGHFREGSKTYFNDKVMYGQKIHTCRGNYKLWKERIDKIKDRGGTLSLREWIDKPYRSKQHTIKDITAEDVGIQKLIFSRKHIEVENHPLNDVMPIYRYETIIDGSKVKLDLLAENDGLSSNEFLYWFAPAFKKAEKEGQDHKYIELEFAIIHFTKYRY